MELNATGMPITPAMATLLIAHSDNGLDGGKVSLTWEMPPAQAFAITTQFMDVVVAKSVSGKAPDIPRKQLFPDRFAGLPLVVKWDMKEDEIFLLHHERVIGKIHHLAIPVV